MSLSNSAKGRTWEFEIYLDSVNPHWKTIFDCMQCDIQVSPIHDKDIKSDGSLKKPHRHVVIQYGSPVTWARVKEDILNVGGVYEPDPRVQYVDSVRAYHTHDTPKAISDGKYQYNIDDVLFFGKNWYKEELRQIIKKVQENATDKMQLLSEVMEWCEENKCYSYYSLFSYCKDSNLEWCRFITQGGYARTIIELLKSMAWTKGKC